MKYINQYSPIQCVNFSNSLFRYYLYCCLWNRNNSKNYSLQSARIYSLQSETKQTIRWTIENRVFAGVSFEVSSIAHTEIKKQYQSKKRNKDETKKSELFRNVSEM